MFSFLLCTDVIAQPINNDFFRNFWNPTYRGQRLNYCSFDGQKCGIPVAREYCQLLGYKDSDKAIIDYNLGITHYLKTRARCRGWECNGFMLIRCVGELSHKPPHSYYYRSQRFVFPRFNHYPVDWCYEDKKGCGQRAAFSFCRRMGYMKAKSFEKRTAVPSTKALGNQKLCFGKQCNGFKYISCFR